MEKSLSGIKDVDLKILSGLEDVDLLSFCKLDNKYIYKLCSDENFWRERTWQKFGRLEKNENRTWKNLYLKLVYYTDKYKKDSTDILQNLSKIGMKDIDLINFFLQIYLNEIDEDKLIFEFVFEAAKYHHFDLVKYYLKVAHEYFSREEYQDILGHGAVGAAESGDREILDFLISEGFDDFNYALNSAAEYGQLDMVKFLYSLGARNSRWVGMSIALGIKSGYLSRQRADEIIEFLNQ